MRKNYNFSAGPAILPEEVLLTAQQEMLDWHGTGCSIMELGHRGPEFHALAAEAEADLRELMGIPENYQVFFLPGGATAQFAMVPINLLAQNNKADYLVTGLWSRKAQTEAARYGCIHVAAEAFEHEGRFSIPEPAEWSLTKDAAYVHYTPNETVAGLEFPYVPETGNVPLVADMTSMILSRPVNVTDYGLIYAGAQKNVGQAGITIVIVRDDLIQEPLARTPTLYHYQLHREHQSFYNTPPTYSWYIMGLVLAWMKKHGGVAAMYAANLRKAQAVYDALDQFPEFYLPRVEKRYRSLMNVTFNLQRIELTDTFFAAAKEHGLIHLQGHRVSGGVRASMYNAFPEEGATALAKFMTDFAKQYG